MAVVQTTQFKVAPGKAQEVRVSSTGGCNSVLEFSGWGHEAEGLTGAGVQFQGDAVQVLLAVR